MGSFERKLLRNKMKQAIKAKGEKRVAPLSKYRFKTKEEMQKEYAEKLTEQMLQQAKNSTNNRVSNDK